jgi:ubiquinone/menaquinone biosynthesis C-methylase UbiE
MLVRSYPAVTKIAVITSDYHITMSCALFAAMSNYQAGYKGGRQLELVGNAVCDTGTEWDSLAQQAWGMSLVMNLPYEDNSFDLVTSGYMLRNVTNILGAVTEMHRVLAPGGKVIVAELARPSNPVVLFFYNMYMKRVKKYGRKYDGGKSIDGRQSAYEWLTKSIDGFPYGEDMVKVFRKAGFDNARFYVKSFGAVNIYVATKE